MVSKEPEMVNLARGFMSNVKSGIVGISDSSVLIEDLSNAKAINALRSGQVFLFNLRACCQYGIT